MTVINDESFIYLYRELIGRWGDIMKLIFDDDEDNDDGDDW